MVHSFEVQIQAYLKQHACPRAWHKSLCRTAKVQRIFGATTHFVHKNGSFFEQLSA